MSADAYLHHAESGRSGSTLMFLFHGTGGDETQFLSLGRDLLPDAALVSPRGDVLEQGHARFFRRTAEGVYDMDDLARATQKMAGFVRAQSEAAQASAVAGLGYSNGANILATTLFAEPQLFDAAVLMHPLIPFQPDVRQGLSGRRVLVTAGRRDPICPPNITLRLDSHLRAMGADVTLEWQEGGHQVHPSEIEAARRFLAPYRSEGS